MGMPEYQKKLLLGVLSAVATVIVLQLSPGQEILGIPLAAAQNPPGIVGDNVFWLLGFLIGLLQFVSFVAFAFLNYLLDPRFIFDLGGGNDFLNILQSIWQLSRDIMNVIFAVMLVFAAIYVIVMNKKDFIQEHVAKFLMAVIFVNFSWFFPRVILDVSSVLTSTVYGIPSLLNNECVTDEAEECVAVTGIKFFPKPEQINELDQTWDCNFIDICVQIQPLDNSAVSASSTVLNGLIINHARLIKMGQVPPPDLSEEDGYDRRNRFMMRQAMMLLIAIATVFPLLAMCIAFLLRIPMLWLTIAFMPFYFLDLVGGEKISQGYGKKIFDNFLSAAFLPALVAIPLTVGYILLNAGGQIAFDSLKSVPFRLIDNVSTLHELMWLILALAIIWTGVFGVLKKQEIIGMGAEKIEGVGKAIGKLAVSTPLSIPIIPGPSGGASILGAFNQARPSMILAKLQQGDSLKKALADIPRGGRGAPSTPLAKEVDKTVTTIISKPSVMATVNTSIQKLENATTPAEVNAAADRVIQELQREGLRSVNRANLEEVLREIKNNNKTVGKINVSEKAIEKLKNPPAAPGAAPAAAAPAPAPAPAPVPAGGAPPAI